MSPKNKKKLNILRKKLDSIDEKLLSIIKIRTDIIKIVITLKKNKKEIVDQKRIAFILKRIRKASIKKKIPPDEDVEMRLIVENYYLKSNQDFLRKTGVKIL